MKKCLGSGFSATCYLTEDNKVIKIFKNDYIGKLVDPKLFNIENDTYNFYKQGIYSNDVLVAVIMDYVNGQVIKRNSFNFDEFVNAIPKVYKDTDSLSDKSILTNDVFPQNILFSSCFKIIDVDSYGICFDNDLKELNRANFNLGIHEYFFDDTDIVNPNPVILENKELFDLYIQTFHLNKDNKTLKEFLILLRKRLEELDQKALKNTKEVKLSLQRKKEV